MKRDERNGIKNCIRHVLAAVLFCLVMSIGMVCLADEQGTVSVASAKIRASADASSEQLGSVEQGKNVDIIGKTTGSDGKEWYQVYVDANTKGFIRADLVKVADKSKIKTIQAASSSAQNTDTTPTTATSVEAKRATVVNNNVRIRKGASTNHDVVATANKGMVLNVTGEADGADGKKWYQVSFTYNDKEITGFIRSDLVTFENVPPDAAESQITGEENQGEEQPPQETEPAEAPAPEQTPEQSNTNTVVPMEAEETPYIMPGFNSFKLTDNGQEYQAFRNGSFYIIYGQRPDGETGWFLFDSDRKLYTRYPYTAEGVTQPNDKTVGMLPVIVLVIIIIVLAAAVGLLLLKLKENAVYGRSYGREEDDYRDDDIEDLEDLEDQEDDLPVQRPQGRTVRRPQGQGAPQGGQPVRRPQPQGQGAPQGGGRPQGARPANGQPNPQRRPQGQGAPQGGQPVRRPQPQNEKVSAQKGYKAKNLLEEDDDMDFMDI